MLVGAALPPPSSRGLQELLPPQLHRVLQPPRRPVRGWGVKAAFPPHPSTPPFWEGAGGKGAKRVLHQFLQVSGLVQRSPPRVCRGKVSSCRSERAHEALLRISLETSQLWLLGDGWGGGLCVKLLLPHTNCFIWRR